MKNDSDDSKGRERKKRPTEWVMNFPSGIMRMMMIFHDDDDEAVCVLVTLKQIFCGHTILYSVFV